MNWDLMLNVVMSMVFFAPLLIALGLFLFLGVLVLAEATVALAGKVGTADGLSPRLALATPGPIAAGLNEAVQDEVAGNRGRAANEGVQRVIS